MLRYFSLTRDLNQSLDIYAGDDICLTLKELFPWQEFNGQKARIFLKEGRPEQDLSEKDSLLSEKTADLQVNEFGVGNIIIHDADTNFLDPTKTYILGIRIETQNGENLETYGEYEVNPHYNNFENAYIFRGYGELPYGYGPYGGDLPHYVIVDSSGSTGTGIFGDGLFGSGLFGGE